MLLRTLLAATFVTSLATGAGCGDDQPGTTGGLADYFPALPAATGAAQAAFAGQVTEAAQLPTGPATSGLVGDYFIKNDRVTFIVQSATRVIGVIPQGGNVVDAVLTDGTRQTVQDHFGELGLIYLLGRTCEPDKVEVIRDGAGGGVAVLRASGKSGNNDFINIKGIGILPVEDNVDPAIPDAVDCATTYILAPGSNKLEVYHSLYNAGTKQIDGPMGTIADTGGQTEAWTNARGFERADISALATLGSPQPSDYVIYQAPGVAYGIIPRHDTPTIHTQASVAGVSILLDGNSSLLDILSADKYFLHMAPKKGVLQQYDLAVGVDGADIDEVFRNGEGLRAVAGHVAYSKGGNAEGARVGVFVDGNGNGTIDDPALDTDGDGQPDDKIISYMDVGADGAFAGNLPTTAGSLLLRAEVKNIGRSAVMPVGDNVTFTIPSPIKIDFDITDEADGTHMPGRLLVVGDHPAAPDQRVFETYDRTPGVVTQEHSIRGTTTGAGEVDPPLYLPAGGTYRIYASRGTEWSFASQAAGGTADMTLAFALRHVNPAVGYYSTDWHVHQIGSPDSNVPSDERVRSAVSAGTEMFAVTDHDYVSDLQPIVEDLGLERYLRVVPGIEVTPFAYGHYNTWPLVPDASANHGAIDWARVGDTGIGMLPGEIYAAMRARGGKMVQVNHPRGTGFTQFQAGFDRANLVFDYSNRMIYGDYMNAGVPNDFLRLPEASLWSDQFNGLEVWNGFATSDSNMDGVREIRSLDRVLRDWFSMLSMGLFVTPAGNSDTHKTVADPVGMPRTFVRVADDSPEALAMGTAVDAVVATQTGAAGAPRDIVVTNGPMIAVTSNGMPALGRVVAGSSVTLTVTLTSPDWAEFDTLEVFANTTPDKVTATDKTVITPLQCWTTRDLTTLNAADPCKLAAIPAAFMTVQLAPGADTGTHKRYTATVVVTLDAADIANRAGAIGQDAWLVFRVRGARGIFPLLPEGAISAETLPALLGSDPTALHDALVGKGVPAEAFASPVFVDFDGGGYKAPFAP